MLCSAEVWGSDRESAFYEHCPEKWVESGDGPLPHKRMAGVLWEFAAISTLYE